MSVKSPAISTPIHPNDDTGPQTPKPIHCSDQPIHCSDTGLQTLRIQRGSSWSCNDNLEL